jgi:hypothetical protein
VALASPPPKIKKQNRLNTPPDRTRVSREVETSDRMSTSQVSNGAEGGGDDGNVGHDFECETDNVKTIDALLTALLDPKQKDQSAYFEISEKGGGKSSCKPSPFESSNISFFRNITVSSIQEQMYAGATPNNGSPGVMFMPSMFCRPTLN